MRKFTLIVLALAAVLAGGARAAEPVIAYTWDEAVTLSKQHGTPILIDFYTDW
jgi:hypothetical protein